MKQKQNRQAKKPRGTEPDTLSGALEKQELLQHHTAIAQIAETAPSSLAEEITVKN